MSLFLRHAGGEDGELPQGGSSSDFLLHRKSPAFRPERGAALMRFIRSHPLRRGEAEQIDARFQNAARQIDQRCVAGLPGRIRLGEDLHVVVELIRRRRQLVDIRADRVRRGIAVRGPQRVRHPAEHQHELLLLRAAGAQQLRGRDGLAVFGQDRLDPHDGVEDIGPRIALE